MSPTEPPTKLTTIFSLIHLTTLLPIALFVLVAHSIIPIPYLSLTLYSLTTKILKPIFSPIAAITQPLCFIGVIHVLRRYELAFATKVILVGLGMQYIPFGVKAAGKVWITGEDAWMGIMELVVLGTFGVAEGLGLRWGAGLIAWIVKPFGLAEASLEKKDYGVGRITGDEGEKADGL